MEGMLRYYKFCGITLNLCKYVADTYGMLKIPFYLFLKGVTNESFARLEKEVKDIRRMVASSAETLNNPMKEKLFIKMDEVVTELKRMHSSDGKDGHGGSRYASEDKAGSKHIDV